MMTRRTAVGAGLAFTAAVCTAGFGAYDPTARRRGEVLAIDALLIDESIAMPRRMLTFIEANKRVLPIVGIGLDAAAQAGLRRLFGQSHAIAGLSSGATLFCLERIAWDHGFRLTERSGQCARDPSDHTCRRELAAFLGGAYLSAASPSPVARAYRPSRADGMLHAWVMQKSGPQFRRSRQEA